MRFISIRTRDERLRTVRQDRRWGIRKDSGPDVLPQAAGVAISPDGRRALVANYYNDLVSLIDLASASVIAEQDLRPGKIDRGKRAFQAANSLRDRVDRCSTAPGSLHRATGSWSRCQ